MAEARGEVTPGVLGLAAPIVDGTAPIAALCFTAEARDTGAEDVTRLRALIAREARAISTALETTEEPA